MTNIHELNKNNDFFPGLLPKEENIPSVLPPPYIMGNIHPNQLPNQLPVQQIPFGHFDSRYPVASQMPYPNNNQVSLGYPAYSFDRFNNLGVAGELPMNNKPLVSPNFDINKQTPDEIQRSNVGVNFLPNLSVPMVGYPVYSQGYPERMNVTP